MNILFPLLRIASIGLALFVVCVSGSPSLPPPPPDVPPVDDVPPPQFDIRPNLDLAIQRIRQEKNGHAALHLLKPLLKHTQNSINQCEVRYWMGEARLAQNDFLRATQNYTMGTQLFIRLRRTQKTLVSDYVLKSFIKLAILRRTQGLMLDSCNTLDQARMYFPQMDTPYRQEIGLLRSQWNCIP